MAQIDRTEGLVDNSGTGIKGPCDVATTTNITLAGEQTIDGVTTANSRVLVLNQINPVDNGIYISDPGLWDRANDFDENADVSKGTLVAVTGGASQGNSIWQLTTANPIVVGTTGISFSISALNITLGTSSGSSLIGFIQSGTSAVLRTVQSKNRDIVNIKDFGGLVNGTTDDSAALVAAFAAHDTVRIGYGTCVLKNITIGTHKRLICEGTILKPAVGAQYILKLTGFKPSAEGFYIDGGSDNITHGRTTNAAVIVDDATYPTIDDADIVNVFGGILIKASTSETKGGKFSRIRFDTFDDRGILMLSNVNTCTFTDIRGYCGTIPSGGLEIPKAGVVGLQIASTGSTIAAGGHMIDNCDFEQCEFPFQFTDAQLVNVYDSFGDSSMTAGFQVTGASQYITFYNCFAGTCLKGFDVAGTSIVSIIGCETLFNGTVPPWGDPAAFYSAGSPFDISVSNTATVNIANSSWTGDRKLFVQSGATVNFLTPDYLYTASVTNIAAGATAYLGPQGQSASEVAGWIAPRDGVAMKLVTQQTAAPGGAETSTDTFRLAGSDSALAAVTTGGAFGATDSDMIFFTAGQQFSVKSVQSGGAAATTHRAVLTVAYFGN